MKWWIKDKFMQTKYTETWVADLGILFYPISWKSSEEKEDEERLNVRKERVWKEKLTVQTVVKAPCQSANYLRLLADPTPRQM